MQILGADLQALLVGASPQHMTAVLLLAAVTFVPLALLLASFANRRSRERHAQALVTPEFVNALIAPHHRNVCVVGASVVSIAHCGDGKASTTDRVVVRLTYGTNPAKLPTQAVLKVILLSKRLRIGSAIIFRITAFVAAVLRPIRLDRLVYSFINWYNYLLPHAPDSMYENEALVYRRIHPELPELQAGGALPRCLGTEVAPAERRCAVLMEDLSLRPGLQFPTARDELSLQHVASLLKQLARLHATYWESPRFEREVGRPDGCLPCPSPNPLPTL